MIHDSYETSERDQRDLIFGWTHRESIRSLSLNRSKSKGDAIFLHRISKPDLGRNLSI